VQRQDILEVAVVVVVVVGGGGGGGYEGGVAKVGY